MSLIFRKTSQWWYGYFRVHNEELTVGLKVRVMGTRPKSLRDEGDAAFERSRGEAMSEHDKIKQDLENKKNVSELTKKLIEIKTGGKSIKSVPLDDMPKLWMEARRERGKAGKYAGECVVILNRFVNFIKLNYPKVTELLMITPEMAKAFMETEEKRAVGSPKPGKNKTRRTKNVSPTTWNYTLKLLRGAFRSLEPESSAFKECFNVIQPKKKDVIHRKPYTQEDLKAILETAEGDDFIRPIIITGICTAMRRADCCGLKWADVNLAENFINVTTQKTDTRVDIPIFPLLRKELDRAKRTRSPFVFPDQQAMFATNPTGITKRVQEILAKSGFTDGEEVLAEAQKATDSLKTDDASQKAAGAEPAKKPSRGELHREREVGIRKASLRDFHSFRVTWVTLALTAGVPMDLVRKVTGHATVQIVLDNYYQPDREHFRTIIQTAMPSFMAGEGKSRDELAIEILKKMTSATWDQDRLRLLELFGQARKLSESNQSGLLAEDLTSTAQPNSFGGHLDSTH